MILPRTSYACRAMEHCSEGITMDKLIRIINPIGILQPLREDYNYYTALGGGITGGGYGHRNNYVPSFALIGQWLSRADDKRVRRTTFLTDKLPTYIPKFILALLYPDRLSMIMIFLSVLIVSILGLAIQAITLDRSYLATMGYIAGEWTLVRTNITNNNNKNSKNSSRARTDNSNNKFDNNNNNASGDSSSNNNNSTPSQWDPRRRYKKGDLIVQNHSNVTNFFISVLPSFITSSSLLTSIFYYFSSSNYSGGNSSSSSSNHHHHHHSSNNNTPTTKAATYYYKANSNSPEGRPFDLYLRVAHDLFRNELGHVSTSGVVMMCIRVHIIFIAMIFGLMMWNSYWGYGINNLALFTALIANLLSCYGNSHVGLVDRNEIMRLKSEIAVKSLKRDSKPTLFF